MNNPTPLKVFLCHAKSDNTKTWELYRYLKERGIQPWFDEVDLLPGSDWETEIQKEMAISDVIIICLSKKSVEEEGFLQREIRFALEKADEMPEGRISLIPVKFDECEIPFALRKYHWVDLADENGNSKMMKALTLRASQLGRTIIESPKTTVDENKSKEHKPIKPKKEVGAKITAQAQIMSAIIGAVALMIATIIGMIGKPFFSGVTSSPTPTLTPTSSFTPNPTSTFTPTFTVTPYICPFHGQTDHETIVKLIEAEAAAVNTHNLDIITSIFSPDAVFYNRITKTPTPWTGPDARYKNDLFNTKFTNVKHFDIKPAGPGIEGDIAYYTSGSMGYYRTGEGKNEYFFNPSSESMPPTPTAEFGSDHWVLQKNNKGCWVIIQMEFNAGHIKFP